MHPQRQLLEELVALYDRYDRPVTVGELADRLDDDRSTVENHLRSLRSYELTSCDDTGWTPTITGRELLDLGLDPDEFVVIDVPDEN